MFNELMELGQRLEKENKLPPAGFYFYGVPIKWEVHFGPASNLSCHIAETEVDKARPFSGRRNTIEAHPLIDEAGYALGVERQKSGKDKKAKEKHEVFKSLLEKMRTSPLVKEGIIKDALSALVDILDQKKPQQDLRYKDILNKDWLSFVYEDGSSTGLQLFEHPEIKAFWVEELKERTIQKTELGEVVCAECSICGNLSPLAKKIPVGVQLFKPNPLHSYNKDAFVSFLTGDDIYENAHLGQCFVCGDTISRVLNYLRKNKSHRKIIVQDSRNDKQDSPVNQYAFFWLKEKMSLKAGAIEIDPSLLLQNVTAILAREQFSEKETPPPDLKQVEAMLNSPWTARESALRIADNKFYLLVLSPNKGRISPREWFSVSLDSLKLNLCQFLDSQRIISPDGTQKRSFPIPAILKAVEASNLSKKKYQAVESPNPNLSRSLLRCAYLGEPPPFELLEEAVNCMRNPKIMKKENSDTLHAVAAVLKMILTFNTEEVWKMEQLDSNRSNKGYLCGKLLAILEEAQLRSARWRINTTLVDRFYGSASSAPMTVFGLLVSRATTDHFPKIRKNQLGYTDLENTMECVQTQIDESGGYPKTLTLAGQAEFSLGFYHQRAEFKKKRPKKNENNNEEVKNND